MSLLRAFFVLALPLSLSAVFANAGEKVDETPELRDVVAAPVPQGLGVCAIDATLDVKSFHLFVGGTKGQGYGEIRCSYPNGVIEALPVYVETAGVGIGFGASHTRVRILATGIGAVQGGAYSLTGNYGLSRIGGQAIVVGGEVGVGMTANRDGFAIPLAILSKTGVGLEIAANFGGMTVFPVAHAQ